MKVDGRITFPPGASLVHRYQVARFADWLRPDPSGFVYRITPRALATAAAQRLDAGRVQTLLRLASGRELPAPLALALQAWSIHGTQAAFEATLLVRTKDAATMRRLKSDPATARYLIEVLSPTVARVQARDREKLALAAARRGLLIDPPGD